MSCDKTKLRLNVFLVGAVQMMTKKWMENWRMSCIHEHSPTENLGKVAHSRKNPSKERNFGWRTQCELKIVTHKPCEAGNLIQIGEVKEYGAGEMDKFTLSHGGECDSHWGRTHFRFQIPISMSKGILEKIVHSRTNRVAENVIWIGQFIYTTQSNGKRHNVTPSWLLNDGK